MSALGLSTRNFDYCSEIARCTKVGVRLRKQRVRRRPPLRQLRGGGLLAIANLFRLDALL